MTGTRAPLTGPLVVGDVLRVPSRRPAWIIVRVDDDGEVWVAPHSDPDRWWPGFDDALRGWWSHRLTGPQYERWQAAARAARRHRQTTTPTDGDE